MSRISDPSATRIWSSSFSLLRSKLSKKDTMSASRIQLTLPWCTRTFRVIEPMTVESGTVAPAFGQLGLGVQFRTSLTLGEMLDQGILEEVH
jgi:hypothetical protein